MSDQTNPNGQNGEEQRARPFNPNEHVVQIKTKDGFRDYLPVQWRLAWFRSLCPEGSIKTEMLHLDLDRETEEEIDMWNEEKNQHEKVVKRANGFVVFRAVVKDGKGGIGAGTKSEKAASFPDYIEKAETGAIGRALAALGFGTQFAPELDEEHRIVDSPVKRKVAERSASTYTSSFNGGRRQVVSAAVARSKVVENGHTTNGNEYHASATEHTSTGPATEKQLTSIHKLCEYLGKPEPEHSTALSYSKAKELIDQLTAEYKQRRAAS